MTSTYDFTVQAADGTTVPISNEAGKAHLIVNVASKCGLTPQYDELEALYRENKGNGLQILGFPCNQSAGQEPGTDEAKWNFTEFLVGRDGDVISRYEPYVTADEIRADLGDARA